MPSFHPEIYRIALLFLFASSNRFKCVYLNIFEMETKKKEKKNTWLVGIGHPRDYQPPLYSSSTIAIGMTSRGKTSPKLWRDNRAAGSGAKTISIVAAINAMKTSARGRKYRRKGRGNRGEAANSSLISWRGVNSGWWKRRLAGSRH